MPGVASRAHFGQIYPGGYPGQGTRQGAWGGFSGYPGRYPGEIPGWPGEYPEVRLPRPRDSLYRRVGASNPNATVSNYQITNIEKASFRAWCIAAIFTPLFSSGLCLALLREREREKGAQPPFLSSLEVARVVDPGLNVAPVQRLAP